MKRLTATAASLCHRGLLVLSALFLLAAPTHAAYVDKTTANGAVRVHYPDNSPTSCDAVLLGVGTAMRTDSYDKLSNELIERGYVVAILDHNPGDMVKTDATKYRNLALDVKSNLLSWVSGSNCGVIAHWVMGGHSAGGQAAQEAVSNDGALADAMFSIDPFDATAVGSVDVPALYWGFDVTTCYVDKHKAAKAAYYKSMDKRAFVRVDRKYSWGPCGYSPKYFHCSFCDSHCPGCTNCMNTPSHFFEDLGNSVDKFITAAFYGSWSKSALSISGSTPHKLFVDLDQP